MEVLREQVNEVCDIWKEYENARSYQDSLRLKEIIPDNVALYQGDQWAEATADNYSFPRPVYNVIKLIGDMQTSILNVPFKFNYQNQFFPEESKKFTRFCNYMLEHMHLDMYKRKLLKQGYKKGTMVTYLYWNDSVPGKRGKFKGNIELELIDVLDLCVSNPKIQDEQKQDWIVIKQRVPVKTAQRYCDSEDKKQLVVADNADSDYQAIGEEEQKGSDLCTLLTKFSRDENGEVVYQRAVKGTVLHEAKYHNPIKIAKNLIEGKKNNKKDSSQDDSFVAWYYPIIVGSWEERENSIYGISGVEEIKSNQKAINNLSAFSLYAVQQQVTGAIIAKDGALEGQEITNEPGQVITDYYKGGNGLYKLQETQFNGQVINLFDNVLSTTRSMNGTSEVMTGDLLSSQSSGYLVQLLQEQAKKPLEDKQKAIFEYYEKLGKVLSQFYKMYFEEENYIYKVKDEELETLDKAMIINAKENKVKDIFNGKEYLDIDFDVQVEVGATSKASEITLVQQMQEFLKSGMLTFEEYVKLMPENMLPNKREIQEIIAMKNMGQVAMMEQELMKYQQGMQVLAQQLKQKTDEEAMLKNEFTNKINQANEEIKKRDEFMKGIPIPSEKVDEEEVNG
jgi:hypothetical protein